VLATLAGCVTVRSEPPGFASPWPPIESGPRPSITLTISGGATDNGWPRDLGPILDRWGMETERAYRESVLFSDVSIEPGRRDLRAAIELRAAMHDLPVLSAFSYLTLLIIPSVVTTDIAMTTRITTPDGAPLGTIEVRGKSRTWNQLLLFPVAPFFEPREVTPAIVYDLNRETISMLHARGVF